MFCEKCGTQISDDAVFCGKCGYKTPENMLINSTQQAPYSSTQQMPYNSTQQIPYNPPTNTQIPPQYQYQPAPTVVYYQPAPVKKNPGLSDASLYGILIASILTFIVGFLICFLSTPFEFHYKSYSLMEYFEAEETLFFYYAFLAVNIIYITMLILRFKEFHYENYPRSYIPEISTVSIIVAFIVTVSFHINMEYSYAEIESPIWISVFMYLLSGFCAGLLDAQRKLMTYQNNSNNSKDYLSEIAANINDSKTWKCSKCHHINQNGSVSCSECGTHKYAN